MGKCSSDWNKGGQEWEHPDGSVTLLSSDCGTLCRRRFVRNRRFHSWGTSLSLHFMFSARHLLGSGFISEVHCNSACTSPLVVCICTLGLEHAEVLYQCWLCSISRTCTESLFSIQSSDLHGIRPPPEHSRRLQKTPDDSRGLQKTPEVSRRL